MDGYNAKSCSALEKPFYTPIEAALRWCNLVENEAEILEKMGDKHIPDISDFPQWKCLKINTERIFDAIEFKEIPIGRRGKPVDNGEQVTPNKQTVRHTDLKKWMLENNIEPKPSFLFGGDVEINSADKRWPWGNHHTDILGHVEAAAKRFWVNYDPTDATTAPTNKDVSEWLITERKVSQKMAESIASILRPDGLATGPRK